MSYKLHVDVIGDEELRRAFNRAPQIVEHELGRALTRTAYRGEGIARRNAPVDTATLRGSINAEPAKRVGNNIEARIKTTNRYARFQEEGTGIYGPRRTPIRPRTAKMLAWKKNGRWHFARQVRGVRPKRYMKKARDEVRGYLETQLKGGLRAITRALAS